ncbi:MAG: hypothetical protein ABR533_04225, partial [Desulfonatronovibrio sp.]
LEVMVAISLIVAMFIAPVFHKVRIIPYMVNQKYSLSKLQKSASSLGNRKTDCKNFSIIQAGYNYSMSRVVGLNLLNIRTHLKAKKAVRASTVGS